MSKDSPEGIVSKQKDYSVAIKYSPEAIEKKLMKFTTPNGDSFEISAEEMISMLTEHVNQELLAPVFVDTEKVNVVQVRRDIKCRLEKDFKAGDEINLTYVHPYPLEFAILEEVYKIAKIEENLGSVELTKELIDSIKAKIQPKSEEFMKKFYSSFKTIDLDKSKK